MSLTTVGVLRGGPSGEYEISLQTGSSVLRHMPERYKAVDILIDKEGVWHKGGIPMEPERALRQIDAVFNALHGEYGEDGKVQRLLDCLHVPYTGSGSFASAVGMNKPIAKDYFKKAGLKTARHISLSVTSDLDKELVSIFRTFNFPVVVKPAGSGSSLGVSIARSFEALKGAVAKAFGYGPKVMVEEHVKGREATCGVVDGFRGKDTYALFPIEIVPEGDSFDYDAKYRGKSKELCPSTFSPEEKKLIEETAIAAHKAVGLRHYSRTDMILTPRGAFVLEVNTLPGLTAESLLPKALHAGGIPFPDFLDHVIQLALKK